MRTHAEFSSTDFPAVQGEDEEINPGRFGRRLAEHLASQLPNQGLKVLGMNAEDWGWRLDLENEAFPLWIGCGNYEEFENGFLCFIEPSRPVIRKWFSKIETASTVERVASAIEAILTSHPAVNRFRWWSESEART